MDNKSKFYAELLEQVANIVMDTPINHDECINAVAEIRGLIMAKYIFDNETKGATS